MSADPPCPYLFLCPFYIYCLTIFCKFFIQLRPCELLNQYFIIAISSVFSSIAFSYLILAFVSGARQVSYLAL